MIKLLPADFLKIGIFKIYGILSITSKQRRLNRHPDSNTFQTISLKGNDFCELGLSVCFVWVSPRSNSWKYIWNDIQILYFIKVYYRMFGIKIEMCSTWSSLIGRHKITLPLTAHCHRLWQNSLLWFKEKVIFDAF